MRATRHVPFAARCGDAVGAGDTEEVALAALAVHPALPDRPRLRVTICERVTLCGDRIEWWELSWDAVYEWGQP